MACFIFPLNRGDEKCPPKEKLNLFSFFFWKNLIFQVAVMVDGYRHFPYKLGGIYLFSNFFSFHPTFISYQVANIPEMNISSFFPPMVFKKQVSLALCHCFSLPRVRRGGEVCVAVKQLFWPSPHYLCLETQEFYSAVRVLLINPSREILCAFHKHRNEIHH